MGRQPDAYYDGMLVGSFRGIRRSDYAYRVGGVCVETSDPRRSSIFQYFMGIEEIPNI
jgi:hypothetical protein